MILEITRVGHAGTVGDYHKWPFVWASKSIGQANAIYARVKITSFNKKTREIQIEVPEGFEKDQTAFMIGQLGEAGLHLAELLNAIHWAK
ncbi:MAG: hypothetical protein ACHQ5A_06400 [Opitutales bacterium]